jgi:secreted PhoX family phosphatase
MVLAGTDCNCAGGAVPEGWISCEESSAPGHGFAYLTRPGDEVLMEPRPIRSWGRFHREAITLDPDTGVVYMTEDREDGCLYRHLPDDSRSPMGAGRLQALVIPGLAHTDPYPEPQQGVSPPEIWRHGQRWEVVWVDVADPLASETACRVQAAAAGATAFNRGEGIAWSEGGLWFTASTGGPLKGGQIFRYTPDPGDRSRGALTLELEVRDRTRLSCPDSIGMAPWGDLIMAEDNYNSRFGAAHQYLRGMTPEGVVYDLARNSDNQPQSDDPGAEFAGVCFSPDGRYLFVNVQTPEHLTIAMTGPWG